MAENFDPYYKWLGIPPKDQPPHHYRLLGIEVFEADRDVIDAAANRLMGYLKELASGDEGAHSQRLLNEISRARLCLLNKEKKASYDRELKASVQAEGDKLPAQPPDVAQPPQIALSVFPRVTEPPAVVAPPQIELGPGASRLDTRSKPPPLKARGSPAPTVREDPERDGDDRAADESGRPRGTRGSSKNGLTLAVAAAAIVACIAIVVTILLRPSPLDDASSRKQRGKTNSEENSGYGVLTLELSDEARREVKALIIDDQPQSLPPPTEVRLRVGRHTIVVRRDGFREVSDRFTLVKDVRRSFDPRWVPEVAKAPAASASPKASLSELPPFQPAAKPLPEMTVEKPAPETTPSAGQAPKPPPGPVAPPSSTPASDDEVQAAAAHGFSSGFGQMVAAWLLNGDRLDQSGQRHNGIAMMADGSPIHGHTGIPEPLLPIGSKPGLQSIIDSAWTDSY